METNQAPQEAPQAPAPGKDATMAIAGNKYTAANDLMFEDCLRSIIQKAKTGKTYSSYKNQYCPKPKHSPFGDFPPEYLPPKSSVASTEAEKTGMSPETAKMKSKIYRRVITIRNG